MSKDVLTLRHTDVFSNGQAALVARAGLTTQRIRSLHGHDFTEIIWVQNGRIRHHHQDGLAILREGDVAIIGSGNLHGVQAKGDDAFVVSVSIHPDIIRSVSTRHKAIADLIAAGPQSHHSLDTPTLAQLNQFALTLEKSDLGPLAAEAFVLNLGATLLAFAGDIPSGTPAWLRSACQAARNPIVFRQGATGFVTQTGRAHAHVSREMRRFMGQTPSDYVNAIRMKHAAGQLVTDTQSIPEIALDCGLLNLSHFHKLFRAHYGMTPLQMRKRAQRNLLQP